MTMTEDDRYHLHQQLERALDERGATTMMELLPPVGWADVATKRDLDQLEERMDLRFDKVDQRFQQVEQRFQQVDQQFQQVDQRFQQVDQQFQQVDQRFQQLTESMNLRFDKVDESMNLRFDATASKFRAELAESGRRMQGVLLTAIVAATSILAALSVFGPT